MNKVYIIIIIYRCGNWDSKGLGLCPRSRNWKLVQADLCHTTPSQSCLKYFAFFSCSSENYLKMIYACICLAPSAYWLVSLEWHCIGFLLELTSIPAVQELTLQAGLAFSLRNPVELAPCQSGEGALLLSRRPQFWRCYPEKGSNRQKCLPPRRWEGDHRTRPL